MCRLSKSSTLAIHRNPPCGFSALTSALRNSQLPFQRLRTLTASRLRFAFFSAVVSHMAFQSPDRSTSFERRRDKKNSEPYLRCHLVERPPFPPHLGGCFELLRY